MTQEIESYSSGAEDTSEGLSLLIKDFSKSCLESAYFRGFRAAQDHKENEIRELKKIIHDYEMKNK